jgi:uncharacterized protein DUF1801
VRRFGSAEVAAVFKAYPARIAARLTSLRELIFETASRTPGVGELDETLKWGQPSYLTTKSKSGSTIRIDSVKSSPDYYAVYFHCQTNLVETFRRLYPREFTYAGNRAILFHLRDDIPADELSHCISLALTYHMIGRRSNRSLSASRRHETVGQSGRRKRS